MMNMKAMHKDFWMEIRKSKARFISIFMIVALGVAFFSGIQASSPDMRFSEKLRKKAERFSLTVFLLRAMDIRWVIRLP